MTALKKKSIKAPPRKRKSRATEVDAHVGARLRQRRLILGLGQTQLAEKLDITFQQVQKYENGSNRISASRLYEIANALDVSVGFFFEGYGDNKVTAIANSDEQSYAETRETLALLRMYYSIKDEQIRKNLIKLARAMVA